MTRYRLVFCLLTLLPARFVCSEDSAATLHNTTTEILFSRTIETGLVFINEEFVSGEYHIDATAETVSINGRSLPASTVMAAMIGPRDSARDSERRGPAGEGGGPGRRDPGDHWDGGFARWRAQRITEKPSVLIARRLVESLSQDLVVVIFDEAPSVTVVPQQFEYEFCKVLVSDSPQSSDLQAVAEIPGSPTVSRVWERWLREYSPAGLVRQTLSHRIRIADDIEQQNMQKITAQQRLDRYSYPLTVAGMLLGVVALGHVLRWGGAEQVPGNNANSARFVQTALCLMTGIAVIDLVWTILAGQAGTMREINPLAAAILHSPGQLALFKFLATATGFGILFAWRQRRQIQVATWWMCLISVLVTFRWIVFDSVVH